MDVTTISQFISNLGFPIACVVAMFYMWNQEREAHRVECEKWVEALNNNTQVMHQILDAVRESK